MRILINSTYYHPEKIGIGKYTGEMAEWLAANGHEVRVVTAPPFYPQWQIADEYANRWRREEKRSFPNQDRKGGGSLLVYRCPLWVPSRPSGLKRVLHLASFALSSFPVMLRQIFWRPNVVVVVEPPLFCAPQAWLAARFSGAKAYLHVQDFEVDAAFDLGILPAWMRRSVLAVECWLMSRFDRVSTISAKMQQRLHSKGVAPSRLVLFPNWVDPNEIFPLATASDFREQLGIQPNQLVALYSGNMGEKQGLEIALEAAAKLENNPEIRFVLCGDGAVKYRLQKTYRHLSNVVWMPLQPVERLNELLNLADVHLLPQRGDVADLVMPSKLLGMLASGRPILATALPDTQVGEVVARCGVVIPPGDAGVFSVALQKLSVDPEMRTRLGKAGRLIAERQFSKESVLTRFEQELAGVTQA